MAHTTTRLGLTQIDGPDPVSSYPVVEDGNCAILDNAAIYTQGTLASRPTANSVANGNFYVATDTGQMFVSSQSAWTAVPMYSQGTFASRPTAAVAGRYYLATNGALSGASEGDLYFDTGATWVGPRNSFIANLRQVSGTCSALNGDVVECTSGTFTVTSPVASSGARFTVSNIGDGAITVSAASGVIYGPGLGSGASSFALSVPGAYAALTSDGTNWFLIAGIPDTGWIAPSLINSWANYGGGYTSAGYRKVGDIVQLRGALTGGTIGLAGFTLPAGYRPMALVILATGYVTGSGGSTNIFSNGSVQLEGGSPSLDGMSFSIL